MAKPLVLDILGAFGVMIDEAADWKAEVIGNHIYFGGQLTLDGLTDLGTLVQLPTSALQNDPHTSQQQSKPATSTRPSQQVDQTQQPTTLEVTQKYYDSVQRLLKHLRQKKHSMKTMGQVAQWFENYGRNVDRLPTLNVDKEMLQYGAYISQQLHGAGMTLKGTTINRRVAEVGATNSSRIYGGAIGNVSQNNWQSGGIGYGGGIGANYGRRRETNAVYGLASRYGVVGAFHSELRQQQQAQTAVRVQARAQAATSVQQIVQNIETATTQIRQAMTEKYQVQF